MDLVLLSDVVGWLGAGCLLAAYALLSAGLIGAGWTYQILNVVGSVGLAVNGLTHRALPSVALNAIWLGVALIALRGIVRRARPGASGDATGPAAVHGHDGS